MLANFNFGDAELRAVSFFDNNIYINVFTPADCMHVRVDLIDVQYAIFESNHMQNVIENILSYNTLNEVPFGEGYLRDAVTKAASLLSKPSLYVHITPISGPEGAIICSHVLARSE